MKVGATFLRRVFMICGGLLLMLLLRSRLVSFGTLVREMSLEVLSHPGHDDTGGVSGPAGTGSVNIEENLVIQPTDMLPVASTMADVRNVIQERNHLLSSVCQNSSLRSFTHVSVNKFVLDHIFVSDKHKIMFCQTPKVGNTQWKKVLMVLNGAYPTVEKIPEGVVHGEFVNGLTRLSSLTKSQITHRLDTYFKFLIVRDPFERLISAFKDKFINNPRKEPWYNENIAPAIIKRYRKQSRWRFYSSKGLHFEEFVRYLGDAEHRKDLDKQFGDPIIHWTNYADLCAPCQINYDVIGHHETLEQDAPYILRAAGVEKLVSYPDIPQGVTRYDRTKVKKYFSGISKEDIKRLYSQYQGDFALFGYPPPDFLLDQN